MSTEGAQTELIPGTIMSRVCGQRDAALSTMREAIDLITRGHELASEAREMAERASSGVTFRLVDRTKDEAYGALFRRLDGAKSSQVFRHQVDASIWLHLLRAAGMEDRMDATAREEFFQQLSSEVAEVNEENIQATLEGLMADANLIFQRGLARAFSDLDKRFKSHDAFKLGSRIILTNVFDGYGSWSYRTHARATISDVERVLAVLDGKPPEPGELEAAIDKSRAGHWGPRQGVCETRYLRIRTFMNGNAHLWFTRSDLVKKANLVLADYYGEVLPDGVPREEETFRSSGLPSKNLSFYRTPPPVIRKLIRDLCLPNGSRVLEPSAGEGDVARELLGLGLSVDAIEIDPGRVAKLGKIDGLTVYPGNFLQMPARPVYDAVVMNPPFSCTHWMEHVVHAYDWLAPGGTLRTVLPVTAQLGSTKKHVAFRAWVAKRMGWRDELRFTELPAESFSSSGTRINTVILKLHKPKGG